MYYSLITKKEKNIKNTHNTITLHIFLLTIQVALKNMHLFLYLGMLYAT